MSEVSIRDLRNRGGDVIDRVAGGERVIITRAGKPVAELRPLAARRLAAKAVLDRWSRVPALDPGTLRRDLDAVIEPGI